MSKTIIERMSAIVEKMCSSEDSGQIVINETSLRKTSREINSLRKELNMSQMQVLILTAVLQKSHRYRIDSSDIASFLGLEYIKFLTYSKEMDDLKRRGYLRMDKDGDVVLPSEVLRSLKENRPVEPEQTSGLDTAKILSRIRRKLSIRSDGHSTTDECRSDIDFLMQENPETSISKAWYHWVNPGKVRDDERLAFAALLFRYYYEDDDQVGWHDLEDYFSDDELDCLKGDFSVERLDLQKRGVIEYSGEDGMLTKDYFKLKDAVKEEALSDVGGLKKKAAKVSASRKIEASAIVRKELFYNAPERRQVSQLGELLCEERFSGIRAAMKEKGMRTAFTCLFYGSPGTGKTETVYQIAKSCGRNLFVVDVSQIKSCWVGESEKNIKDVFSKYRQCVASGETIPILLFNEADAIFGIRQEGAGSAVDKMENTIQNIILQEMEDLDGILIATTNLTCNLDKAFERRFLYKIRFDKPSIEAKSRIWKSMLPELSEDESLQLSSDFDFSGGQIENIARKKTVKALISGEEPSYAQIREYCAEEVIAESPSRRKIGF